MRGHDRQKAFRYACSASESLLVRVASAQSHTLKDNYQASISASERTTVLLGAHIAHYKALHLQSGN
jgi:hypothetical protein